MEASWIFDVEGVDSLVCSVVRKQADSFKQSDDIRDDDEVYPLLSNMKNNQAVVCYGIDPIRSFDHLCSWLEENDNVALVYLEHDVSHLLNFLSNKRARSTLKHSKVFLFWLDPYSKKDIYEKIAIECCGLSLVWCSNHQLDSQEVKYGLQGAFAYEDLLKNESQGKSQGLLQHYYSNLKSFFPLIDATSLEGAFSNTPALVCGAGPSLAHNVSSIQEFKKKGLVFAGGSALGALFSKGIEPHFTACVDPNEEQFRRMQGFENLKAPCFMVGRSNHKALHSLGGTKIFVPNLDAFPISYWVEDRLGFSNKNWDQPLNVVHVCLLMAYHMGCNPIILCGMDLSVSKESAGLEHSHYGEYVEVDDIFGNPVLTIYQWIKEAEYIKNLSLKYKETKWLNATQAGIGIEGVKNVTLSGENKKLEKTRNNLSMTIRKLLDHKQLVGSNTDLVLREIYYSLINLEGHFLRLQNFIKTLLEKGEKGEEIDERSIYSRYNNMLRLLGKEVAYDKLVRYQERVNLTVLSRKYNHLLVSNKEVSNRKKWKYLLDEFVLLGNAVKLQVSLLSQVI